MRSPMLVIAVLALTAGCRDEIPTEPRMQYTVLDAPQVFGWLPPLVKEPQAKFANDATLLPHVRVRACALPGNACVTLDGLQANDEQYHVNWKTSKSMSGAYRLMVDVAGTVVGQLEVTPKPPQNIPVMFRIARNVLHVVSADGGVVSTADGAVTLSVPQGALESAVAITVAPLADYASQPGVTVIGGSVFDFAPDGTQFDPPARVTLRYEESALPDHVAETQLVLGHYQNGVWRVIRDGIVIDTENNTVSGPVSGFSAYGIVFSVSGIDVIQTVWGRGTATIDGVLATGEWAQAAHDTFTVFFPDGTNIPGDYYVMNDAHNLYVAVKFARSALDFETHLNVSVGTDQWVVSRIPVGTFFSDAHGIGVATEDVTTGGTNDGAGAVQNDGAFTTIELAHPFDSNDNAHDISAKIGELLRGYNITLMLGAGGGGVTASFVPPFMVAGQILLTGHLPVLSGMGTAAVDGVVSAGEWDFADCTVINVNHPSSGPVAANFCVMNDAANIYTYLEVPGLNHDFRTTYALHMDASASGDIDHGDDLFTVSAERAILPGPDHESVFFLDQHWFAGGTCPVNALCSTPDVNAGGFTNGSGHYVAGGVFEMAHPINSGDALDIGSRAGEVLGVRVGFAYAEAVPGSTTPTYGAPAITVYPGAGLIQIVIR